MNDQTDLAQTSSHFHIQFIMASRHVCTFSAVTQGPTMKPFIIMNAVTEMKLNNNFLKIIIII